jgi:hypothetical protein
MLPLPSTESIAISGREFSAYLTPKTRTHLLTLDDKLSSEKGKCFQNVRIFFDLFVIDLQRVCCIKVHKIPVFRDVI